MPNTLADPRADGPHAKAQRIHQGSRAIGPELRGEAVAGTRPPAAGQPSDCGEVREKPSISSLGARGGRIAHDLSVHTYPADTS